MSLTKIFSQFSAFGFSGSRKLHSTGACLRAVISVPKDSRILVGCADGIDAYFRVSFQQAEIFYAHKYGTGKGRFAARSVAVVKAVKAANGLWVSFPSSPCPTGLLPSSYSSKAFCGSGSGSWASLAFALGSKVPCLIFLGSVPCPTHWGLAPVPGWSGWFACPCKYSPSITAAQLHSQLSLF